MSAAVGDGVAGAMPGIAPAPGKPLALVVDDSPFLALHMTRLLTALGLRVQVTGNAAESRALAAQASVVFVELELFHASGFELMRELAAHCTCPLVLLTGTGRTTDLQWGLRAGASAVLQRPITEAALCKVLDRLGCVEQH